MIAKAAVLTLLALPVFGQSGWGPGYVLNRIAGLGDGQPGFAGDGGAATSALLNRPCAVAVGPNGDIYIADSLNHRVRRIRNGAIETVAGTGAAAFGGDSGAATSAHLNSPCGVAVDGSGNLYIADTANHRVRRVSGGIINTVAGNGIIGAAGDGGPATSALLNYPLGLALDSANALYIADSANHRVRKVASGTITTVAGLAQGGFAGEGGFAGDGGPATSARLSLPSALALAPSGQMYILDSGNSRVRQISGGIISTLAGGGLDGVFRDARGIAVDGSGNVIVADTGNQRVRMISGGTVSTIAGNGTSGVCGETMPARQAQLGAPYGIAAGSSGLYVADYRNNRVVVLTPGQIPTPPVAPYFEAGWMFNSASYAGPEVSPGEITTIFGDGLGPNTISYAQLASNDFIATETGGTRVYFNERAAPMVFSLLHQISAVVPYEVASNPCTVVEVEYNGVRSGAVAVGVKDHAPGIYSLNAQGFGPGTILNEDWTPNSAANPAARGSFIIFWGTGEGQTNPPGVDGKRALTTPYPRPLVSPVVYFGTFASGLSVSTSADYAGASPTFTAGLMQINVRVPANAPTGPEVPLSMYFGNTRSRTELTVAIR